MTNSPTPQLKLTIPTRTIAPGGVLTPKQFAFVLYLALRRSDGSDGWVTLEELVTRVPYWLGQGAASAGREVARLGSYGWFRLIEQERATLGPYRLIPEPHFEPNRDAGNEVMAARRTSRRLAKSGPTPARRLSATELQAYDLLIQYGIYLPAVVDHILRQIGQPETLPTPDERLMAYRILATLYKNKAELTKGRAAGEQGLKLAKRLKRLDDTTYLLDQLGGMELIGGRVDRATSYFEEEVAILLAADTRRARFHLVGAYRGLAAVRRVRGDREGAIEAIRLSRHYAVESGNTEGLRLAALEATRLGISLDDEHGAPPNLQDLPSEHVVARLMALRIEGEAARQAGNVTEARRLLTLARSEALRFGLMNEAGQASLGLAVLPAVDETPRDEERGTGN